MKANKSSQHPTELELLQRLEMDLYRSLFLECSVEKAIAVVDKMPLESLLDVSNDVLAQAPLTMLAAASSVQWVGLLPFRHAVERIMRSKIDVGAARIDEDKTLLMTAVSSRDLASVKNLIGSSDLSAVDKHGRTALDVARSSLFEEAAILISGAQHARSEAAEIAAATAGWQ